MATAEAKLNFPAQIQESRKKIRDCLKRSHEALQVREKILLSRIDEIENEYRESLKALDNKITEATTDTHCSIEFEWDNLFETEIEEIGSIKLSSESNIFHNRTFPPQVKTVVPDYRSKQLPTAYRCKKSSQKAPGELNSPRGIAIDYKTRNLYIADTYNNRIQVFSCSGDYLFVFSEKMDEPFCICVFRNKVFATQLGSNCINVYEQNGKYLKSAGREGNGEGQFKSPRGIDVSYKDSSVYVCDSGNDRVQILTKELQYHSMLGIGLFHKPRIVKLTRKEIFVLDDSDPCIFVLNSGHVVTNRLISRGGGKQTNSPRCFDVDRDYNIILSDYNDHCIYIFNQEGKQIQRFGKAGQGIGEFHHPWGIVLDNTGHIVVVCEKNNSCLQFF